MRVLTVRQPWAWAIIHAEKDVENRGRNIAGSYRGPVAIHAAAKWAHGWLDTPGGPALARAIREAGFPDVDFGSIIGVVDLDDSHDGKSESLHAWDGTAIASRLCSPWAEPDVMHLHMVNPRPLRNPIPYTGALGLRTLDNATRIRIESELS